MRHIVYSEQKSYDVALLIKETAFNAMEIEQIYAHYLDKEGISKSTLIAFPLAYNDSGKAPTDFIKKELENLLLAASDAGVKILYCADANYFKVLTSSKKAEPHLGYVLPCKIPGYEYLQVVLGVNHKSLLYNPANEAKLDMSLATLVEFLAGKYTMPGCDIVHEAYYPTKLVDIESSLLKLHQYTRLTCDIEGFSLDFEKAGIATITFCWDQHHGIAFACDYRAYTEPTTDGQHGEYYPNIEVRKLLREFFESYQGSLIFHNATYDISAMIVQLWMEDLLDTNGLLKGLEILTRDFHDTKIIAYLATNTTADNTLKLKELAHSFAGNWANDDITDIRRIPLPELLSYNLIDGLSTHYVFNKYYPQMVADQQEELYLGLMLPSQKTLIQVEMTGMPMDPAQVQIARKELEAILKEPQEVFKGSALVRKTEELLRRRAWEKDFETRVFKAKKPEKIQPKNWDTFPGKPYNPSSGLQTRTLLYEVAGLPVIDLTATKQPAVGGETLEKLKYHAQSPDVLAVVEALIEFSSATKILGTFIPAFEKAIHKGDGVVWLHGNFNLGGTVSGRLSSSNPNLQNLPAGSKYGKLVKKCFKAPDGWIFCGADFNALEDRINALLTKDPNKLKVFIEGYDSHCLRTYYYWPDQFPNLHETPEEINSIKNTHPHLRQKSKGPSFALQYQGTWLTMVKNSGFSEEEAKAIEANFQLLYAQSIEWVQERITEASKVGYSTAAFGLRIRTPMLHASLMNNSATPKEAAAEARTLGNAISGQSYGLLTNRAVNAFMKRVWASPYRFDVKPVALIHDAIYLLIRDDVRVVEWVNRGLIHVMQWQELPEIQHDQVKLTAELSLFWPTWADEINLPNDADQATIRQCVLDQSKPSKKSA